ncbi:MAG: glycerol acyltransferase [bacterium]|nr:glycerol acyltransferase [bacterium]
MNYTIYDTPILKTLLRWGCIAFLKVFGWKTEGSLPEKHKFVMIAAPHTTNWDLPMVLTLCFVFRVKIYWMGKKEMFRWPFGPVMRWLGGLAIDRTKKANIVDQTIDIYNSHEEIVITIPPEGTRKQVRYWKTGFYHIAHGAGVPIVLGYIDYKKRIGGVGGPLVPSGDLEADMTAIKEFYSGVTGKYPYKNSGEME